MSSSTTRSFTTTAAATQSRPKVVLYWEGNTDGTIGGSLISTFDLITQLDRSQFHPIAGFAQANPLVEQFKAIGVETYVYEKGPALDVRKSLGTGSATRCLALLLLPIQKLLNFVLRFLVPVIHHAFYLRRRGVDLIDLNNSINRNHEWMLASLVAGVKCVTHEAGINHHYSRPARFFHRRMRAILCCSEAVAAHMRGHGLDHPRLRVVHPCVSSSRMQVRESPESVRGRLNLPAGAPVIGMAGNIKGWKGQETVVRATALLAARHPQLVCLLVGKVGVGDEPFYEKLKGICRELGIEDRVIFTGYQPNPGDYMNVMDVVIHASVHPEPFGIVNIEAMGLGKPVVATNIGGPVEVFEDGISGFLIEPGVPERLAEVVDRLLTDPALARGIGAAGRRRRESHFRLENTVEKTQTIYRDVLDMPASVVLPSHQRPEVSEC